MIMQILILFTDIFKGVDTEAIGPYVIISIDAVYASSPLYTLVTTNVATCDVSKKLTNATSRPLKKLLLAYYKVNICVLHN